MIFNYLDLISNEYLLSTPVTYTCDVVDLEVPRVSKDKEMYVLDMTHFSHDDFISRTLTSYNKKCSFTTNELNRLPHELIRCLFSSNLEMELGLISQEGNDSDTLTPDIVNHRTRTVAEISTSAFNSKHARSTKENSKGNIYRQACTSRGLSFGIISVSLNDLTTDFNFDTIDGVVRDIIAAYNLGRAIQKDAQRFGYVRNLDVDINLYDLYNDQFEESSDILDRFPKTSVHMTSKMWQTWSQMTEIDSSIYAKGLKSSKNSINKLLRYESTEASTKAKFDSYLKSVRSIPIKTKQKKIPVPMAMVKRGVWYDTTSGFTSDHPMSIFWREVINRSIEVTDHEKSYNDLEQLNLTVEEEKEMRDTKYQDLIWKDIHRISVPLTDEVLDYVSEKGLYAKKREEYVVNTGDTIGFDIGGDVDYSDYEAWLSSWEDMMLPSEEPCLSLDRMSDLFDMSTMPSDSSDFIQDFMRTKLASSLDFFSACAAELNINIRKPTPSKKMYVTRIRGYNAKIAMHNTGSDKHTFYSILVKKEDIKIEKWMDCFTRWIDLGDYMCTEICSTRKHDLSMHLSMISKSLSIISMTKSVFSDKIAIHDKSSRSNRESLLSILICLENGNQTSEICMLPRFNYMQTNVYLKFNANYAINASKYPTIVRTRLGSYIIHRIINSFIEMARMRDIQWTTSSISYADDIDDEVNDEDKDEGFEAQDTISNAISYISGKPLKNYEEALLLSYVGIYHNKDKAEKAQSYFQIFSKLLKMEIKMRDAEIVHMTEGHPGDTDPSVIRDHEFSGTHLRNAGLSILEHLASKGIDEEILMSKILHDIDSIYYEELATLKSSAQIESHGPRIGEIYQDKTFDLSDENMQTSVGRKVKAMQGVVDVMRLIDAGTTQPFREMSKLVTLLELHGGVVAVLFKKNQLNGVREIFILTMIARIVIRLLESVSRTIATECEGEYLTKGSEKSSASPNHYSKVQEKLTANYETITLSDSLDCQTWCQNFVMPAFGHVLSVITRSWPELGDVLRGILNAVSAKRHEMPYELMKFFTTKPEEESRDKAMRELKEQFLGEGGDLINSMSCYIKNVSNMMQGILHFTTTITHIGHLYALGRIARAMLLSHKNIVDVVYTVKCSSDDASIIISVIIRRTLSIKDRENIRSTMAWMSQWIRESYPMMCAKVSKEKSTCLVFKQVEEFNSQWTYRNTSLSVPTKFGFAAVIGSSYRSVTEKQRLDHNLINDYLANGGVMQTAKIIEFSCAMQHYEALGMYVVDDDIWNELKNNLILLDHHYTYRYTESHPIIGTISGFDFSQYCKSKRSQRFRMTEGKVKKYISGQIDDKLGLTISANMIIGSDKMYFKFMESIRRELSHEDTMERIESDPSRLYRNSDSIIESKDRIYLKSITPGIGRSFAFMSYSLQQQSSSYILSSPSITVSVRDKNEENDHIWVKRKMSLPAYLFTIIDIEDQETSQYNQSNEMYDNILDAISPYRQERLKYIGRRGKKIMKLHLPKLRLGVNISLMSCVKYLWFNVQNGYDYQENVRSFFEHQRALSWLCLTYQETVDSIIQRGYDNPHMVINTAITKHTETDKSISFMTAARKTTTIIGTMINAIIRLYKKDCVMLKDNISLSSKSTMSQLQIIESRIVDNVLIPPELMKTTIQKQTKVIAHELLQSDIKFSHDVDIIGYLQPHYRNLLMMVKLISADIHPSEIKDIILTLGTGFIVSYIKAQKKVDVGDGKYEWKGEGEIRLDFPNNGYCLLFVYDDIVTQIRTNKSNSLNSIRNVLSRAFKFLKLKKSSSEVLLSTGLSISREGNVYLRSMGKTGIPVLPLFSSRPEIDITGSISINEGKNIVIDVFTKERIINSERPAFLVTKRLDRRWMKSESIKFFPKINSSYEHGFQPSVTLMNTLITQDVSTYESFLRTSLIHRLQTLGKLVDNKYRNILSLEPTTSAVVNTIEEDVQAFLEMDFDDDFDFEEVIGLPDAAPSDMDVNDLHDFNLEDFLPLETVKQNFHTVYTDYSNLIIWDKWIERLEDISGKKIKQLASGEYRDEDVDDTEGLRQIIDRLKMWGIVSEPIEQRPNSYVEYETLSDLESDDDEDWISELYGSSKLSKPVREFDITNYNEIQVKGDGLCGAHALKHIFDRRMISLTLDDVISELREIDTQQDWFLAHTLKVMCDNHGINLIVYNMDLNRIEVGVPIDNNDEVISFRINHFNPMSLSWDLDYD